ncbi:WD repeat-containing protein 90 [Bagarius yarrelli]|uniref:WD repeat-containing protein 90 n=1 Tax=Bagarius yarrelli TaxID=175774 RepID=A0A556U1E5_BAGYA|nr:WD repeat-containing protein 90 [Bagarius yarrelli]
MASKVWQHPYVNIFKHVKLDEWRKASKEGDVTTYMDKTLKCTVFRVRGSVPASNYILIPKTGSQSLGLTGRYLYLLFRPCPNKHFVVHLDVAAEEGQVIRVSFSSLFKEFKSTATWLQFPFLCPDPVYESTAKTTKHGTHITFATVHQEDALMKGLVVPAPVGARWTCLMMDLRSVLSVYLNRTHNHLKSVKLCANMAVKNLVTSDLLLDPSLSFSEFRQAGVVLPEGTAPMPRDMCFPVPKGSSWHQLYDFIRFPSRDDAKMPINSMQKERSSQAITPESPSPVSKSPNRDDGKSNPVQDRVHLIKQIKSHAKQRPLLHTSSLPELTTAPFRDIDGARSTGRRTHGEEEKEEDEEEENSRIVCDEGDGVHVYARCNDDDISSCSTQSDDMEVRDPVACVVTAAVPRPFALPSSKAAKQQSAVWAHEGEEVVYPCHAIVISMKVSSGHQRFFIGHTDKVSALALNSSSSLLASAQTGTHCLVRLWNYNKGETLTIIRTHTHSLHSLSMVSCGMGNVRLWRVRGSSLRSCPVNLGQHHSLEFTDLAFEQGHDLERQPDERTIFVSSRSGHILEIDYASVTIQNIRRLLPSQHSRSTEHEGPVSLVCVSSGGLSVLAATSTGNLGYLDVSSRGYRTLMRSHTDMVLGFSVDGTQQQITTASRDGTVRIWDMDSAQQLYDFVSDDHNDTPSLVAFHPKMSIFACGSSSGTVRVFDIPTQHRGAVVGLVFSPDGERLYSAGCLGYLALYNASQPEYTVRRVLGNMVVRDTDRGPDALAVSSDNKRLAFVGPTEYTVTVADAHSLDELLRVDVSVIDVASTTLDSALKVCFSPSAMSHLLVTTSANKILWMNSNTGRLLREVSEVHKDQCTSLSVSEDGRYLLTAGHNAVKVWDYNMKLDVKSQVFIGHSEPITQVSFTPDQMGIVSVGDAIFFWDFLAHPQEVPDCSVRSPVSAVGPPKAGKDQSGFPPKTVVVKHNEVALNEWFSIGTPRKAAPLPSSPPPILDTITRENMAHEDSSFLPLNDSVKEVQPGPDRLLAPGHASFLQVTERGGAAKSPTASANQWAINDSGEEKKTSCPDCYKHFMPRYKTSALDPTAATPPSGQEGISLKAVIGYNGNGRSNMVWNPDTGLFVYSCGCVLVLENLHNGSQRHWLGHSEEISTLAVTHDAKTVVSASGGGASSKSLICMWNVENESRRKSVSYHKGSVQSLAFSRDDVYFLSVGDFEESTVVLWSTQSFELLCLVRASVPLHEAAFCPSSASQLAYVGSGAVFFCYIRTHGQGAELQVESIGLPEELAEAEVTALCYDTNFILYTATNSGRVCVWNCDTHRCFMTWEADDGEIGVLLCRSNRLLTGSNSKKIKLWSVAAVQNLRPSSTKPSSQKCNAQVLLEQEMILDGTVVSAAFDDVMGMGIVGTTAGTLWYINWTDNTSIRLISGHKSKVNSVVCSPDEHHFVTCGADGSVRVWALPSNELLVQFQVLNQSCECVCWSPAACESGAAGHVAGGYSDGSVRIFGVGSAEMELKLQPPHHGALSALQYSHHGQVLLSGGRDGIVVVSSPSTGATLRIINDHKGAPINAIQCTSKQYKEYGLGGNELWLAVSADRRVSIWASDWAKDKCELLDWLTFPAPAPSKDAVSLPPSLAAFSPTERGVVVYTGYAAQKELTFYCLKKKQVMRTVSLTDWALSLSLCPRGRLLAVGLNHRVLKLIDSSSGRFQDFVWHSDSIHHCSFSVSGNQLLTTAHGEVFLWSLRGL